MKEASYYINTPDGIICQLCPRYCYLDDRKTGNCRTRIAKGNKLYSLSYNNLCSVNVDPIEKKPLYHFLPGTKSLSIATLGCVLHCKNCQNYTISQISPENIDGIDISPKLLMNKANSNGCRSISYTYTDPVAYYEYAYDCAKHAHSQQLRNVFISSGFINKEPLQDISKYLDAANIDLKSFNDHTYEKIFGGKLETVLNSIKILNKANVWLELTYLIIPTINDILDEIKQMCDWLCENGLDKYPLHFSRFFPYYKLDHLNPTPIKIMYEARQVAIESGIKYVYLGNIQDEEVNNTFCPKCNKLLISRNGYQVSHINIRNGECVFCNNKIEGVWE